MPIVGTMPVALANGTLADATQVMTDFNYIASQVNANGAGLTGGNAFTGAQTVSGDAILTASAAQAITNKTNLQISVPAAPPSEALIQASIPTVGSVGILVNNSGGTDGSGTPTGTVSLSSTGLPLVITTNALERMRIDFVGNVGIGGSAQTGYKLQVFGNAAITAAVSPTRLDISNTNANAATRNWAVAANQNVFGDFAIRTSAAQNGDPIGSGLDRLTISPAGLVATPGGFSSPVGVQVGNVVQAGLTTLDWYERGVFTPIVNGIGAPTYVTQTGEFQRVGNKVKFRITLVWTGGTNGATISSISALPYASTAAIHPCTLAINILNNNLTFSGSPIAYANGAASLQVVGQGSAVASTSITNLNAGTKDLYIAGEYFV